MKLSVIKRHMQSMRTSGRLRDLCLFAGFVFVAAVFWCILTLNEDAQTDFEVRVKIVGVPDSVTLITDPPERVHVSVRDRGSHLLRMMLLHEAEVKLNFSEYAADGTLRVTPRAMLTHIRAIFGQGAAVSILSTDSICIPYTSAPGKLVPVRVVTDVSTALGKVVSGNAHSSVRQVKLFARREVLDTITYVCTEPIVRRNVSDPFTVSVRLSPMRGVRMEPATVEVTVPVEPLENRRVLVPVSQINVPKGESIVLFPDKVEVRYLVPMSRGEIIPSAFSVLADYRRISSPTAQRMPVVIGPLPHGVANATLATDSVEFTIIRHVPDKN